jgi:sugar phosphate isomerase/epimerase
MDSSVFALTLDTGHELCLSAVDAHVFSEYPERLLHLHLHDARGKSAHLPLGAGDVEVMKKISMLRGETCLIEVKTLAGLAESVEYMKQHNLMK